MKKLGFIVMPLMAVSFLMNCGPKTKTYLVKFTSDNKLVEEKKYKENEVIVAPKSPAPYEKDHKVYTFEAWYDGDFKFETGLKATKNYNFIANFTSEDVVYTVTFKDKAEDVKTVTGKFGDPIDAPTDPEGYDDNTDYYHYDFDGWYDNKTKFVKGETTITGNQTFTSKYTKGNPVVYIATFHAKGKDETVEFNVENTTQTTPETGDTPTVGHTLYWLIGSDLIKPSDAYDFEDYLGGSVDISYDGIANPHTITLMVNGIEEDVIDSAYGEKVLSEDIPQTEDYYEKIDGDDHYYHHFTGKWTKTQGGSEYYTKDDTVGDQDITIYAEFQKAEDDPIKYTVNFLDTDGETELDTKEIYCPDSLSITAPKITKEPVAEHVWGWVSDTYEFYSEATIAFGDGDDKKLPIGDYDFVLTSVAITNYTIAYVLGDEAAINPESNPKTYARSDTITLSAPTLNGFTFGGWYLKANESDKFQYQDGWEPGDITGNLTLYADWHVTDKTLDNNYNWEQISKISSDGEASKYFDIGETKTVKVNELDHKVRIIGFNHDDLADGSGKAGITFEFANVITNSDGNADTTNWNNKGGVKSTNYKYSESTLNDYLNVGEKCIFKKLPDELKADGIIKEVYKPVAEGSSYKINTEYTTKLFPLSYREMTVIGTSDYAKEEGSTYPFYTGDDYDTDDNRIKKKVGGDTGEHYWIRSPYTLSSSFAWRVYVDGNLYYYYYVYNGAFAVAPAFCI